ncbi:SRPBCC domain-containing protein [Sneathiella marina]|uniref:SRPBCC domain-containing protein n=1 Tax=Sneathiella marina TaxID=2950108 RepID=A0ABY4W5J4_9PROT|nr:SRPBCC domain-containing protein [Sneathiella marina]USG62458.1 SRPBCC domain-containing protein [Sneathiella marina]
MIPTKFKYFPELLGVALIMALMSGCSFKKTADAELFIPASPQAVWSVLMDAESYGDWNPFFTHVDGNFQAGDKLNIQMQSPNSDPMTISLTVKELVKNSEINLYGGIPWIMTFDLTHTFKPENGGTRISTHEEFHGLFIPFWDASWVSDAYDRMHKALKKRVADIKAMKEHDNALLHKSCNDLVDDSPLQCA